MKRFFRENIILKVAALVLSIILWLFVTAKGQTEISLNVPVEYTNISPGLEIAKRGVETASIVIRGHESLLKNLRKGDVRVNVDVSKAKKGEWVFNVRKDDVKLPYTVAVTRIEPPSMKIVFEETASKTVAIKPVVTGLPETGYYVKSMEIRPQNMLVEGAKSEVRKVSEIKTEPIDITGLTEDFSQTAGLDLSGRNIRTRIDKVNVKIIIMKRVK